MFYQWYITLEKIAKIFPAKSNKCWKCGLVEVTFYHLWWACPKVKNYWENIHKIIQEMTDCTISLKPELFLLNILPERSQT